MRFATRTLTPGALCVLAASLAGQTNTTATATQPPQAVASVQDSSSPCVKDHAYTRLDFWLGNWDVVDDSGQIAGSAVIKKILGGCAIQYQWKDPDGSETLEIFYYVLARKQWRQVLISDGGRTMERTLTEEGVKPDTVRFEGKGVRMDGSAFMDRSTVTPVNGQEVHQLIERSLDGKTWQTGFDARYKRRKEP
jgi:hypothetical protein